MPFYLFPYTFLRLLRVRACQLTLPTASCLIFFLFCLPVRHWAGYKFLTTLNGGVVQHVIETSCTHIHTQTHTHLSGNRHRQAAAAAIQLNRQAVRQRARK